MIKKLFGLCLMTISALCFALPLICSASAVAGTGDEVVWHSRDQFIRIVPRESTADSAGNDHPVRIALSTLRRALSRPAVTTPDAGKPLPLFGAAELDLLAEHVTSALQRCSSDEEIVFAVFGYHPALMGLAKEERVTTGRIFHKGGELNLILGMVQQKVDSREDRRLAPFLPGSRAKTARLEATVSPGSRPSAVQLKRGDWLVFKLADEPAGSTSHESSARSGSTPAEPSSPAAGSVEERLTRLKSLRDRELISDDDYKATKQRILNEL